MVVPEARYDRASSKTNFLCADQDSGPQLLSAQAGGYVLPKPGREHSPNLDESAQVASLAAIDKSLYSN